MTDDEKRLIRSMAYDKKMAPVAIAPLVNRDLSSVCRLLKQKRAPKRIGRPTEFTEDKVDKLVKVLEDMVEDADANYEVTLPMVMRRARVTVCEKVVLNALHKRGYYFRKLRSKMILTPQDVHDRYKWAKEHIHKTRAWWLKAVHIHLDNHCFKVASSAVGRKLLAKRRIRGVYRMKHKSLRSAHVKPNPKTRLNTGPKGILKMGGVGGGKVLVWKTIIGSWSGATAATMYTDVVQPALQKQYAGKRKFTILEDNDPTGNMSRKGLAAKAAMKLAVFTIPKRSPDLNVLDYAIWGEVERRLRIQEAKMSSSKYETRAQFEARLNRTAANLPKAYIDKAIGNMAERVRRLHKARGGLFEEGGRSKRRAA